MDSIIYICIIFIHELGHFFCAKIFKWDVDKIYFYIYGGYTKFNDQINKPLYQELLIMISGPVVQIIFFLFMKNYIPVNYISIFTKYHYAILFFNMLPIYPLDGGKLLNIISSYFLSFKKSLSLVLWLAYFFILMIIFFLIFNKRFITISLLMMIMIIVLKLKEEFDKKPYYVNKFLLERYLHPVNYRKTIIISNLDEMYRDKRHLIKTNNKFITEKEALKRKFIEYT